MSKNPKIINVDEMTVTAVVDTKLSEFASAVRRTWVLNYEDVPMAELLEKASRSDVITLQQKWRKKGAFEATTFNVALVLREKVRLSFTQKVSRAVDQMTPFEKMALLEKLQKENEALKADEE